METFALFALNRQFLGMKDMGSNERLYAPAAVTIDRMELVHVNIGPIRHERNLVHNSGGNGENTQVKISVSVAYLHNVVVWSTGSIFNLKIFAKLQLVASTTESDGNHILLTCGFDSGWLVSFTLC